MIKQLEVEIFKVKFGIIQFGEENVRCDLLVLVKYGINFFYVRESNYLFFNYIIERIIGRV